VKRLTFRTLLRSALFALLLILLPLPALANPLQLEKSPSVVLQGVAFEVKVKNASSHELAVTWNATQASQGTQAQGEFKLEPFASQSLEFVAGEDASKFKVAFETGDLGEPVSAEGRAISGWLSLLPPLVAIGLALITKQVLVSLMAGIFCGALLVSNSLFGGFAMTLDTYLIESVTNTDHAFILFFTMSLGGMVSLISASGGMQGVVDVLCRWAKTPASTQLVTWLMGIAIFFDDYANTLLVGQTMKPVTDQQKVSREKLAYLVDSTAAPIASVALISTWIGYEISLINDGFKTIGLDRNVYLVFLQSIGHRFYAILALAFVFAIAWLHRDFGPMLKAERRAYREGVLGSNEPGPMEGHDEPTWGRSAVDAVLPVGLVLVGTILGLVYTGLDSLGGQYPTEGDAIRRMGTLISEGNSYKALLWAATGGGLLSALIAKLRYKVSIEKITEVYMKGVNHMMSACVVLVLAWAIGDVCKTLLTGNFLVAISSGNLSAPFLPTVTFLLSAAVAFATGTSWGTMAIVMPLAIRLAWELPAQQGLPTESLETILIATIAGVLAGATFGDHCSPISDTTIMSSMASGCDHIEHVRTQIPYAAVTAAISIFLGTIPAAYGVNPWLLNVVGIIACFAVVRFVGKPVVEESMNS